MYIVALEFLQLLQFMQLKLNECRKMCMKMISVIQCQNLTGSIALRLSGDALSYSIGYASDELRWKRQVNHSKLVVNCLHFLHFLLKIMCVYFLPFKNIFKDLRKEKNHFKKITVFRQFSNCEISNFGTDQLRDMGRIQWWVSCVLTIGVQANVACCRCRGLHRHQRCLRQPFPCPYK